MLDGVKGGRAFQVQGRNGLFALGNEACQDFTRMKDRNCNGQGSVQSKTGPLTQHLLGQHNLALGPVCAIGKRWWHTPASHAGHGRQPCRSDVLVQADHPTDNMEQAEHHGLS